MISFEGLVKPERGTAAYITFCAGIGLASGALVLSIAVPAIGDLSYWIIALAPAAGAYYWCVCVVQSGGLSYSCARRVLMPCPSPAAQGERGAEGDDEGEDCHLG